MKIPFAFPKERSWKNLSMKYFGLQQEQSQKHRKLLFINTVYTYFSNLVRSFNYWKFDTADLWDLLNLKIFYTWYWMLNFCWCQHKFELVSNRYFFGNNTYNCLMTCSLLCANYFSRSLWHIFTKISKIS